LISLLKKLFSFSSVVSLILLIDWAAPSVILKVT